jgi:hypothetical protein
MRYSFTRLTMRCIAVPPEQMHGYCIAVSKTEHHVQIAVRIPVNEAQVASLAATLFLTLML